MIDDPRFQKLSEALKEIEVNDVRKSGYVVGDIPIVFTKSEEFPDGNIIQTELKNDKST